MTREPAIEARLRRAALVVCGYGSHGGQSAMRCRVRSLRDRGATAEAAGATLFGEPRLEQVIATLRASPILVVPLLLAKGVTYETLRDRINSLKNGRNRIVLCNEFGSHPGLAKAMTGQLLSCVSGQGWRAQDTGVVLIGHGTRRHDGSRLATQKLAADIATTRCFAETAVAFLEEAPGVEEAVKGLSAKHVLAVGCFAEAGRHAIEDVPARLARCGREVLYSGPIYAGSWIEPLIFDQAIEGLRRFIPKADGPVRELYEAARL